MRGRSIRRWGCTVSGTGMTRWASVTASLLALGVSCGYAGISVIGGGVGGGGVSVSAENSWTATQTFNEIVVSTNTSTFNGGTLRMGLTDDFGRSALHHFGPSSILKMGASDADSAGDSDVDSEGIVVYKPSTDQAARIKADRIGLTLDSDQSQYYFLADSSGVVIGSTTMTAGNPRLNFYGYSTSDGIAAGGYLWSRDVGAPGNNITFGAYDNATQAPNIRIQVDDNDGAHIGLNIGATTNSGVTYTKADTSDGGLDSIFGVRGHQGMSGTDPNEQFRLWMNETGATLDTNKGAIYFTPAATGVMMIPPAAQTIVAGSTIAVNACGTLKRITSAGAVTTDTVNTFAAPDASGAGRNDGCIMYVINVGAQDITLDANALFVTPGAADVVMTANDAILVASDGTKWYALTALVAN